MTDLRKHVSDTPTHRFAIGTTYKSMGSSKLCTVQEQLTTRNSKGEIVSVRYVATHDFLGQQVTDYDVIDTTIARGLVSLGGGA